MLNEERIRSMTRLAIYENNEGKKTIPLSHYYKSDYVSKSLMKSFVYGTISFGIMLGMWMIYQMDNAKKSLFGGNLEQFLIQIILLYLIFVIFYLLITYIYASVTFSRSKKSIKKYQALLKIVEKMHEREGKLQPPVF